MLRLAISGADAVVANSEFLASGLRARFPACSSKTSTIYNGIDYSGVESGRGHPELWPPGQPRLLSALTLNFERKTDGARVLIDAFDIIRRECRDASYLIAAKSDNAHAVDRVRAHLERQPSSRHVRLDVNRRDVPDLLATADLFLYATPPDSSDSLPRALLEAQAASVPTVTTDTTGCGEAVLDGQTGRVVPYDASAVAEAALGLLENRDESSRMARTAKKTVRERFNWEAMAAAYEEVFLRAASRARP